MDMERENDISFKILDAVNEPVIVLRDGREVCRNSAAAEAGTLPDEVMSKPAPFECSIVLGGKVRRLSARQAGEYVVCTVCGLENDNTDLFAALGINLSDWVTEMTLSVGHLTFDITNPHTEDYLSMLRHSIHSVSRVAGNLLYLGEADSVSDSKTVDLDTLVRELADSVNALSNGQTAHVDFKTDDSTKLFVGSEQLLERALLNLLSNSMKATQKDGKITMSCEKHGDRAFISVSDTGTGIPEDMMGTLFNSYTKRRSLTNMREPGFGLAVTYGIVTGMGGTLLASNRKGGGAEVTVILPITENLLILRSPSVEYRTNGMSQLQTELSCVLDYTSYRDKFGD